MHKTNQADAGEHARLRNLEGYSISRTPPEPEFDGIVRLAAEQLNVPIAFFCTAEAESHWFKAQIGIDMVEVPRTISFCDYTIKTHDVMVVPNTSRDPRFAQSPMVTGAHHIRFYAGAALRDANGFVLGTLAVADIVPRRFTKRQRGLLRGLADIIVDRMELRRIKNELRQAALDAEDARQHAVSGEARLQKVLDCLPQGIVLVDEHNKFVLWNKNYEKMFPYLLDHLKPGFSMETAHRMYLQNERHLDGLTIAEKNQWVRSRMKTVNRGDSIIEQNRSDGRWIRYDQHLIAGGGKICVRSDITDDRDAAESFRLLFESNPVPMWLVEKSTLKFIDVNTAALRHYGYTREQFLNMTTLDIRPPSEHARALADVKNNFHTEIDEPDWVHLKADGTEILVSSFAKQIKYNGKDAAIIGIVDVTERRKQDARIKHLAEHCVLTGLPNRRLFLELLDNAVVQHVEPDHILSVILVDIDNFKDINDSLGHYVGDGLITALADRLAEHVGNRGTVARLGGDEFAVLLPKLKTLGEAHAIGNELVNAFSTPLKVREHEILVGISAGVSISIGASLDASTLLKNADLALYKSKSDGRGVCRMFEPQMALGVIMRREMEQDLRQAITRNQIAVHYQPLIELAGGTEIGFEALLRWNHPDKGKIQPADFIAVAETTGMIVPLGIWALEQACLTAVNLEEHLSVAVNVSPAQFKSGTLVAAVTEALKKSGLAAGRLELEITESSLLENSIETLQTLNGLRELGVSIVLDDFGKGHSGLGCLNSFQFDKIKIDRSFVMEIGFRKKSEELVRAAVNIGQNLGIKTLAEGIETKEQFEFLRNLGCQQGQGFLFSRAVPANKIPDRLKLQMRMRAG